MNFMAKTPYKDLTKIGFFVSLCEFFEGSVKGFPERLNLRQARVLLTFEQF